MLYFTNKATFTCRYFIVRGTFSVPMRSIYKQNQDIYFSIRPFFFLLRKLYFFWKGIFSISRLNLYLIRFEVVLTWFVCIDTCVWISTEKCFYKYVFFFNLSNINDSWIFPKGIIMWFCVKDGRPKLEIEILKRRFY